MRAATAFLLASRATAAPGNAIALPRDTTVQGATDALLPLSADPRASETAYVQARCWDFVWAVRSTGAILRSNPVSGQDDTRDDALNWANRVDLDASFPLAMPMEKESFIQAYLDAFGGVDVHQPQPRAAIYATDKAFCEPLFKRTE